MHARTHARDLKSVKCVGGCGVNPVVVGTKNQDKSDEDELQRGINHATWFWAVTWDMLDQSLHMKSVKCGVWGGCKWWQLLM